MAKLILENTGEEEEIEDGNEIKDVCENNFEIPFECKDGLCGTCMIEVVEGNENLSEKNESEKNMFPDDENERLACQCKIKQGVVKIKIQSGTILRQRRRHE